MLYVPAPHCRPSHRQPERQRPQLSQHQVDSVSVFTLAAASLAFCWRSWTRLRASSLSVALIDELRLGLPTEVLPSLGLVLAAVVTVPGEPVDAPTFAFARAACWRSCIRCRANAFASSLTVRFTPVDSPFCTLGDTGNAPILGDASIGAFGDPALACACEHHLSDEQAHWA